MRLSPAQLDEFKSEGALAIPGLVPAGVIETASGAGLVLIIWAGGWITIDPAAVDPQDVPMLEDLILAAVNEVMDKAQELASQRLGAITGGMNIPGLT